MVKFDAPSLGKLSVDAICDLLNETTDAWTIDKVKDERNVQVIIDWTRKWMQNNIRIDRSQLKWWNGYPLEIVACTTAKMIDKNGFEKLINLDNPVCGNQRQYIYDNRTLMQSEVRYSGHAKKNW